MLEGQLILMAAAEEMQRVADPPEKIAGGDEQVWNDAERNILISRRENLADIVANECFEPIL